MEGRVVFYVAWQNFAAGGVGAGALWRRPARAGQDAPDRPPGAVLHGADPGGGLDSLDPAERERARQYRRRAGPAG